MKILVIFPFVAAKNFCISSFDKFLEDTFWRGILSATEVAFSKAVTNASAFFES